MLQVPRLYLHPRRRPTFPTFREAKISYSSQTEKKMNPYVEVTLSWLLRSSRGHESKCFHASPAFSSHAEQTITVTSPDCGASPAALGPEYVTEGGGRIPALSWAAPADVERDVAEWLIVVEDPDAPLPTPICHGYVNVHWPRVAGLCLTFYSVYGGIAPEKRQVDPRDFEIEDEAKSLLKGGFHWGKGRREGVYVPPRPLMNHGTHRCKSQLPFTSKSYKLLTVPDFFQVVALSESLDKKMLKSRVTREQVAEAVRGKVLGWGLWIGSCERRWK